MKTKLRKNLREAYNRKARDRDRKKIQDWKLKERESFLSLLLQEQKETFLEIGAGTGKDSLYFQEHGLKVVCIDLSPEMVKLCKEKGLSAKEMDFGNLQFAPNSFDAVYALNCLLHLPKNELPSVLRTINSILKSNGLFYLGLHGGIDKEEVWEEDSYEPKRFFSFYEDEHLKRVLRDVFEIYSFTQIENNESEDGLHFQSVVLRKSDSHG